MGIVNSGAAAPHATHYIFERTTHTPGGLSHRVRNSLNYGVCASLSVGLMERADDAGGFDYAKGS